MRRLALVMLVIALLTPVWAADKEPQVPAEVPPYGPLKPMGTPPVRMEKLANGLTVWMLPRAGYPKVSFLLAVHGGFAADPAARPGIAEFLAATVDQGTSARSSQQIAQQVQGAGGELKVAAESEAISLQTTVLAARAPQALAVLADVAQNAQFPTGEVETARGNLENSIARRATDAGFMAQRVLAAEMFRGQPYAVVAATPEAIAGITAEELRAEYARRFRPDASLLVIIGEFDGASMLDAVRREFGSWRAPAGQAFPTTPAPQQLGRGTTFVVPRANSVQTRFLLASVGPSEGDPEYAASLVATLVCGRRISKNVREDKGYAYSSGSEAQAQGKANLLITAAAVRNPVTGATWNELRYELDRMASTEPAAGEVERARNFLIGYQALGLQSQNAMASRLAQLWLGGLPPEQLGRDGVNLEKVTPDDVARVGRAYLPASRMTVVAVGDAKTIEDQLSVLGSKLQTAH